MLEPRRQGKKKLAGRYRNAWPVHAEISGRMIPKRLAGSYRNGCPDDPEIRNRFPNLIAGLVLVQLPNQQQAYAWRDLRDPKGILQTPVIGQVALQILKKRRMKDWYAASLGNKDMVRAFTETSTCGLNHGACFCLASGFQRLLNDLPEWKPLDKPTLILWGGIDKTHKHTNMSSTKELVVNATYIEMMGSGHFPDLEESEKVIEFLNDFIF